MGAVVTFLLLCSAALNGATAGELAKLARSSGLDPAACYRVRDLRFARDELKIYFSEGYLVFAKPVQGQRVAAIFSTEVEGGDGEVLLIPPFVRERRSLASFTGSPTLNEHVQNAVLVFTDDTAAELLSMIQQAESKPSPEMGNLLAEKWNGVIQNFLSSFEVRLAEDLLSPHRRELGFFFGAFTGKTLGNFDVIWDPRAAHQISVGQVAFRENRRFFDTWTHFQARPWRTGTRRALGDGLRIQSVKIQAEITPELYLRAVTTLRIQPERREKTLALELSQRMKVTRATVDGQAAEAYSPESIRANLLRSIDNQILLISAGAGEFEPAKVVEVELHHEGQVILEAGNNVYYVGSRGSWYPNRTLQFALYDVTFRYPKSLDFVAAGEIVSEETVGDFRVTRRKTSAPVRLFGFNLGDFERKKVSRGALTVEVCANRRVETALQPKPRPLEVGNMPGSPFPPRGPLRRPPEIILLSPPTPDPTAQLVKLANEISDSFAELSARLGPPPLNQLIASPIPGRFGQGFPGLLYLSTLAYLDPAERQLSRSEPIDHLFYSEIIHAHEVAHQWWGNGVTSADYQDDWLMEALANYCALLLLEKRKGSRTLEAVLESYRSNLLKKLEDGRTIESAGPVTMGHRLYSSQSPASWSVVTYEKGSWILHMLRRRLGDGQFWKLLNSIYRQHLYNRITTEEFHRAASQHMPAGAVDPKLENFFETWVYGTGIPTLKLSHTLTGKAPKLVLRVTVTQSAVDEEFSTWVPVEIQLPRQRAITKWVQTGSTPVSFDLPVAAPPTKVVLNPGYAVLAQ
ncbi:MAG: M1 family aminopeptidase [Bryobacteraceae bacterium]|nr:M1 family aminopeptidase [Bryobacteraceae bacterium]MDW8379124.1 M1 family aminopeptidase [Bryobacterales bacterium]